jgi:hypothetical protein
MDKMNSWHDAELPCPVCAETGLPMGHYQAAGEDPS